VAIDYEVHGDGTRAHPERVSALLIIGTGPGFKKNDARGALNRGAAAADKAAKIPAARKLVIPAGWARREHRSAAGFH
jgi:hypothetical protein